MKKTLTVLLGLGLGTFALSCLGTPTAYTLTIPKPEVAIGEPIIVHWTSPLDARLYDWITYYPSHLGYSNWIDFTFTTNANHRASFVINEPGTYTFQYFVTESFVPLTTPVVVHVSDTRTFIGDYTVATPLTIVGVDEPFTVVWTTPAFADARGDWIGIYPADQSPAEWVRKVIINRDLDYIAPVPLQGAVEFTMDRPGRYRVQYFERNSFVDRGSAVEIQVIFKEKYILTVDPQVTLPHTVVKVHWESPLTANIDRDWISLYREQDGPESWEARFYVEGQHVGNASFLVPDRPGVYKVRYFKHNHFDLFIPAVTVTVVPSLGTSYGVTATPTVVNPGESVRVSWTSPREHDTRRDWIGLYKISDPTRQNVVQSEQVALLGGAKEFTLFDPGMYEWRYFTNSSSRKAVAVSQPVTVRNPGTGNSAGTPPASGAPGTGTSTAIPLLSIACNGNTGGVTLSWNTVQGEPYSLLLSQDMNRWICVANSIGTGTRTFITLPSPGNGSFFRLTNGLCTTP